MIDWTYQYWSNPVGNLIVYSFPPGAPLTEVSGVITVSSIKYNNPQAAITAESFNN